MLGRLEIAGRSVRMVVQYLSLHCGEDHGPLFDASHVLRDRRAPRIQRRGAADWFFTIPAVGELRESGTASVPLLQTQ